ncbi:MAG: hypothetical protein NTV08_05240 [Verrucomicrobia bacterium]|nr:hypothetical protein [Verrucomicrobiota bacterium]
MPEPDPQPPHPRPISATRWLLMLLPSVPMLVSPLIANADARSRGLPVGEAQIANAIATFFMNFWASAALSIILGFLLEKWRHGTIEKLGRPISYGVQILIINFVIAFAGCTVGAIGTMATHP